jgi:hypothetical protein
MSGLLRKLLSSHKTEIGIVVSALGVILFMNGIISQETVEIWETITVTWTGISLKRAIKKSGPK